MTRNTKGEPIAMVVNNDNVVEQRILAIERAIGNHWLVLSGLAPGDRVVVEGQLNIRPGVGVRPVPAALASSETNPVPSK